MKPLPFALITALVCSLLVRSQDVPVAPTRESAVVPVALPTTARILGNIPDGTPPPPQPPKPVFVVPARDILATTTHQQGGRTITIRKIKPIALPPPPEPTPVPLAATDPAFQERLAEFKERLAAYRALHPRSDTLFLSATVYRSEGVAPRTFVRYWPGGTNGEISFWSSADFALISGIHSFADSAGKTHDLFMGWGYSDTDRMTAMLASRGREYHPPVIPGFPAGPATYAIVGTAPAAELLMPIQALHDLYNNEYERLKTAYEGRERARIEREAYLKAHPPQPRDITLNYWRTEKPAAVKGRAK
jgi:hypothetical protein